jgi:hypothetical protein
VLSGDFASKIRRIFKWIKIKKPFTGLCFFTSSEKFFGGISTIAFAGCRVSQGPVPSTSLDVLLNCYINNITVNKIVKRGSF